jgi:DNA repair protein RecO (recombination protein O)
LAATGYALQLDTEAATGAPVEPAQTYDYIPDAGPVVVAGSPGGGARVRGSALLALAADAMPRDSEDLAALRRLMRMLIAVQVGDRGLQSWRVLGGLRSGDRP